MINGMKPDRRGIFGNQQKSATGPESMMVVREMDNERHEYGQTGSPKNGDQPLNPRDHRVATSI